MRRLVLQYSSMNLNISCLASIRVSYLRSRGGELPFQGFEERLHGHGGVVVRAALAGERLDEPAILELPAKPPRGVLAGPWNRVVLLPHIRVHHESFFRIFPAHSVVKGVDYHILVDAGGTCHPAVLREDRSR